MILGIDTGTATCGWAVFDYAPRRFVAIGAFELARDNAKKKTDDHADRIARVAEELAVRMCTCDVVVVERMSFPPGGTVPIALGFGAVMGLARALVPPPRVYTVSPQDWQRAVLPATKRRVDYVQLERVIGGYVRKDKAAAIALDSLAPKVRNHAIDACAIALMGAFRLHECRLVGGKGSTPQNEAERTGISP